MYKNLLEGFNRAYGIKEDTVKTKDGKWANVGKDGKVDSGKFETKKAADAQRRAMFANGLKEDYDVRKYTNKVFEYLDNGIFDPMDVCESLLKYMSEDDVKDWAEYNGYLSDEDFEEDDEDLDEKCSKKSLKEDDLNKDLAKYQKWVDYDMKRYGRISDNTQNYLKNAGLEVVKDDHGDYEVIAKEYDGISEDTDLSNISGTSTKALQDNIKKINSATTPGEVYDKTVEVLEMSGINTNSPSISKMLNRLQRARTLESAFSIVYNSLLTFLRKKSDD